jgi:hypothetical protein
MLEGGWPYADAWEQKGPAVFLLYALAFLLFGRNEAAIYPLDLAFLAAALLGCMAIGRQLARPWIGALGGVVAFIAIRNDYWTFAQPDTWVAYLMLVLAALVIDPARRWRTSTAIAAGLIIGIAVLIKPLYAALGAIPAAALVAEAGVTRRVAGRLAVSAIVVTLLVAATFAAFWAGGKLDALVETYILFNLKAHVGRIAFDREEWLIRAASMVLMPRLDLAVGLINVLALFGLRMVVKTDRVAAAVLATGLLVGFAVGFAQNKFFFYQFMPAYAFTGLLAGLWIGARAIPAIARLRADRRRRRRAATATGVALAALAMVVKPQAERAGDWWASALGVIDVETRERNLCEIDFCAPDSREIAALIRQESAPGDPIFVWGFDAIVYFLADRPHASRYAWSYPAIGGTAEWRERTRRRLLDELTTAAPRLIAVQAFDNIRLMGRASSSQHLEDFPELREFIAERYTLIFGGARFLLYRRNA